MVPGGWQTCKNGHLSPSHLIGRDVPGPLDTLSTKLVSISTASEESSGLSFLDTSNRLLTEEFLASTGPPYTAGNCGDKSFSCGTGNFELKDAAKGRFCNRAVSAVLCFKTLIIFKFRFISVFDVFSESVIFF